MVKDTVSYLHTAIVDKKRILVECAQSTILDIDFGQLLFVVAVETQLFKMYSFIV